MKTPSQEEAKKECCDKCANGAGKYTLAIARPYCLNKLCPCHSTPPRTEESWVKEFNDLAVSDQRVFDTFNHEQKTMFYMQMNEIKFFFKETLSTQKAKDRAELKETLVGMGILHPGCMCSSEKCEGTCGKSYNLAISDILDILK